MFWASGANWYGDRLISLLYIYIYTMNILLSRNNRFLSEYSGKLMSKLKTKVYYVRKIVVLK